MARKQATPAKRKTGKAPTKSTGETTAVAKVPQPHGGALNAGGTPGNKGGGRTPDYVRQLALDSAIDEVVPKLRHIVRFSPEDADVISAGRELLKVAIPAKQQIDIMSHPDAQRFVTAFRQAVDEIVPRQAEQIVARVSELLGKAA